VQRKPAAPSSTTGGDGPSSTPPKGGIDKTGFIDNMNNATLDAFKAAIEKHIASPTTRAIPGEYRGLQNVTHFIDPTTGLNVTRDSSGNFLSGWKLSTAQLQHVLMTGKLGGGR
jgi:hypothetical protein